MKTFFSALLLCLASSLSLGAESKTETVRVSDPNKLLHTLRHLLRPLDFESAFRCGDKATYEISYSKKRHERLDAEVVQCDAKFAVIRYRFQSGSSFERKILRSEFPREYAYGIFRELRGTLSSVEDARIPIPGTDWSSQVVKVAYEWRSENETEGPMVVTETRVLNPQYPYLAQAQKSMSTLRFEKKPYRIERLIDFKRARAN